MNFEQITTPFGQRSMTLAMLGSQLDAAEIEPDASKNKWKLFRDVCEARTLLHVSDRSLVVLNALLSFYPEDEICEETGLIVFPSNQQLSLRSHGMAPATLRRHLTALVSAGLINRKDSPNGKRFQRKVQYGHAKEAFGFSLAPLLARAHVFENMANHIRAEQAAHKAVKERLTLYRRDIAKMIEMALADGVPGNWGQTHEQFRLVIDGIPRNPDIESLKDALTALDSLRDTICETLENYLNTLNMSANESQNERHIQNSKPDSNFDLEPAPEKGKGRESEVYSLPPTPELRSYPLGMVLQAYPDIKDYGPNGMVTDWYEFAAAVTVVQPMLGISPSAYEDALRIMGREQAAVVIAGILQRAGEINSAGGYLRALTEKAENGEFTIGPMLMASLRLNTNSEEQGNAA